MNTFTSAGSVHWECPSNIAIVKYWGKHGRQLPKNPSISFTLSEAKTNTKVAYRPKAEKQFSVKLYLDGTYNEKFSQRTEKYFTSLASELSWIPSLDYEIHTQNTFPHSSGIASSASGMGALALCLCDIGSQLEKGVSDKYTINQASYFARLGSGSACRSLFSTLAVWGSHELYPNSSDLYAVTPDMEVHEVFNTYHDDILIVSNVEKSVSSTAGHALMDGNVYAPARYQQAYDHMSAIVPILKSGDADAFGIIAEQEALVLHALMMASSPSYILLAPSSIEVINAIRAYRLDTKLPVYFTIDAGPNIHLLYPDTIAGQIAPWINDVLKPLCHNGLIIKDKVGQGPQKIG